MVRQHHHESHVHVLVENQCRIHSLSQTHIHLSVHRYSLFEWDRLSYSGENLSGVHGKLLRVTPEELARHSVEEDAWIAIRGENTLLNTSMVPVLTIYKLDTETRGSTAFRNPRALSSALASLARYSLGPSGF